MSGDREHGVLQEDLPGYALGALTGPEAERLEAHLERCERCRAELRWLRAAVDMVAATVEQVRPPSRLRRRLMATVRRETRAARSESRWGARTLLRPAFSTAAVAAVLGATLGYVLGDGGQASTRVVAEGSDPALAAIRGELVHGEGTAILSVSGLPRLGGRNVYQAWVRDGDEIEPSTTFVLDRGGAGVAAIPQPLDDADEVMVTREPRGGSLRPSTAPLLTATPG